MNIFLIPSWYPDETNSLQGIFIKEQFEEMSELYPGSEFVISNLINYNLPLKKPADAFKAIKKYLQNNSVRIKKLKNNLIEISNPVLTWTVKLNGNIRRQLILHENNFLTAKEKLGRVDLIHAHVSYPAGLAAMKLNQKYNIPYIITEHMGPFPFKHFLKNGKLNKQISEPLKNSGRIIAVSSSLAKTIESFIDKKAEVIPNLVNEKIFKPDISKIGSTKTVFLTVASLIESKGISELLDAARICIQSNENINFRIAGSGIMEKYILNFIEANKLSGNISLHTGLRREKITEEFRNCDAYILTSRHESFGISYVEALACGKPVIATDCGGPSDFIIPENGILVPVGNVDAISDAVLKLTREIHLYDSEKIRDYFMKYFSRNIVCSKIYNAYESVIASR